MCRNFPETAVVAEEASPRTSQNSDTRRLDEEAFPGFAALLRASQDYARLSGCRFSLAAFDGIEISEMGLPIVSEARARDAGALLRAKLSAAPVVKSTAEKLKVGDHDLEKELARAFQIVMKESTRNSMIARCKELELYPPSSMPPDVDETDCSWDDVSAPLPTIAQRLYNDEVQRLRRVVDDVNPVQRHAKTASYIVEFADEVGINLSQNSEGQLEVFREFEAIIAAWKAPEAPVPKAPKKELVGSFFQDAGDLANGMHRCIDSWTQSETADKAKDSARCVKPKAGTFVAKHCNALRVGTAAVALVGATGMTSLRLLRRL